MEEDQLSFLDITLSDPSNKNMDPYELFSTPPTDMLFSSTPNKQQPRTRLNNRRGLKAPNSARKAVLNERLHSANPRSSISFDADQSFENNSFEKTKVSKRATTKTTNSKKQNNSILNKSVTTNNRAKKKNQQSRKKEDENLWDKCMKSNPELAQFVDNFNHSLEEATSKPLDMSGNE